MKNLVLGLGEIGAAISKILQCDGYDPNKASHLSSESYDVLHVCYPYFPGFEKITLDYKEQYKASLIIIHSTVPIGTSEQIGNCSVSSPCRGVHPHLEEGIRTFVKYFGGIKAEEAASIFFDKGIKISTTLSSRDTEALKLWDTSIYGWNIILEKEIYRFCEENNLSFDTVYTLSNQSYNDGYTELGMSQYKKYILGHKEGKIGGHCIIPNCDLLNSWVADLIKEKNEG